MNRMKTINISIISILLFAGVFCTQQVNAQEAKKLFVSMPDSLCPYLTSVNRADCVDFLESKMKAVVDNRFGLKSEMTDLSKDYVKMKLTASSDWQMKVLALNDSTNIICTITTVCGPACDSKVRFYTTQWKELSAQSYIEEPQMKNFLLPADSTQEYQYNEAMLKADIFLMKATFDKGDTRLVFELTTPDYMDKESAEKLKPFLRRLLVFQWKEGTFKSEI